MAIEPIPIQRYLVPPEPPPVPDTFTRVDQRLLGGLPHPIEFGGTVTGLLIAPTGLAVTWRDSDPTMLVSSSEVQREAFNPNVPGIDDVGRLPVRLLVRRTDGSLIGVVPLAPNLLFSLPAGDATGPRIELMILAWDIRAGNVRGPGDFGGRIALAWRPADQAVEHFSTLPAPPVLQRRLKPAYRMESDVGRFFLLERVRYVKGIVR